jgi:hypothetical protein
MSGDLDIIRAFRAEDAVVDDVSQTSARAALLAHIAGSATGGRGGHRPHVRRRFVGVRIRFDVVAIALSILVVVGVGTAFLTIGSKPPHRPAMPHQAVGTKGPPVIRNFSPHPPPALPGQTACTAELTRPGVSPGGVFWPSVCQFQPLGGAGSPNGTFHASTGKVNGVSAYRFLITASGLGPNNGRSMYAVWLLQAAPRYGTAGTFRLLEPQTPQLLGVIEPGVAHDGTLAAEGSVPAELLGSDYLLLITLQHHTTATTPGRTVLRGFVSL